LRIKDVKAMIEFSGAGMTRFGTWVAAVAFMVSAAEARAQSGAGGTAGGGTMTAARVIIGTKDTTTRLILARLDSLKKLYETLPVGSAESNAVETAIQAAVRELPRAAGFGSGTYEVQVRGTGMALRTPMDVVPQGWLGFTALGLNETWFTPGGTFLQYLEYPAIVTVEANSPASRAGVRAGDSLVAYNNRDVISAAVNMTNLLIPGREVSVRVRRSGETRDVLMTVEKASEQVIAERRRQVNETLAANQVLDRRVAIEQQVAAGGRGGAMAAGRGLSVAPSVVSTGPNPTIVRTERPPMAAVMMPSTAGVLGAGMTNVNANMAAALVGMKGKTGVFVTTVPEGSLAARTGLLEGDVILRVESKPIETLAALRVALAEAQRNGAEKIKLSILRAGKSKDLTYVPAVR
jgi:membrane-associated protease RseP (regulator of RpoE activity)